MADANKYTDSEIVKLQNSLSSTSSDLGSLKTDLGKTQTEVGSLKTTLDTVKGDLGKYAKTEDMTLAIDEAKAAAITAAADKATKQSQDWVENQKFAKQDTVTKLDQKVEELVLTNGAYSAITLAGNSGDLQMKSNGNIQIVGDDSQNITTEVVGNQMKIKLADDIRLNKLGIGKTGVELTANDYDSVSLGKNNLITGKQSLAIGTGLTVSGNNSGAFGDPTVVTGDNSYSIGNNNTINSNNTYALGSNITATAENSVFLGDSAAYTAAGNSTAGTEEYATNEDAIGNIKQGSLKFAGAKPAGVVSVGDVGKERRIQNVAAGKLSADSTDAVNGSQLYSVAEQVGQVANGSAGVVQYTNGTPSNEVTVVGANPNAPVTIQNVAAGTRPTDAVNVGQLNHAIGGVYGRMETMEKHANAGIAQAMATGSMASTAKPGKGMLAIAGGSYRGEAGYAIGYSQMSDNGRWLFKATGSGNSRGHYGVAASVGLELW
ncbi:MAG: YadA-like family protein [Neisseriaceae bacterium]|nr:YadA-like family protein [Neisseriaceae bacterium]